MLGETLCIYNEVIMHCGGCIQSWVKFLLLTVVLSVISPSLVLSQSILSEQPSILLLTPAESSVQIEHSTSSISIHTRQNAATLETSGFPSQSQTTATSTRLSLSSDVLDDQMAPSTVSSEASLLASTKPVLTFAPTPSAATLETSGFPSQSQTGATSTRLSLSSDVLDDQMAPSTVSSEASLLASTEPFLTLAPTPSAATLETSGFPGQSQTGATSTRLSLSSDVPEPSSSQSVEQTTILLSSNVIFNRTQSLDSPPMETVSMSSSNLADDASRPTQITSQLTTSSPTSTTDSSTNLASEYIRNNPAVIALAIALLIAVGVIFVCGGLLIRERRRRVEKSASYDVPSLGHIPPMYSLSQTSFGATALTNDDAVYEDMSRNTQGMGVGTSVTFRHRPKGAASSQAKSQNTTTSVTSLGMAQNTTQEKVVETETNTTNLQEGIYELDEVEGEENGVNKQETLLLDQNQESVYELDDEM